MLRALQLIFDFGSFRPAAVVAPPPPSRRAARRRSDAETVRRLVERHAYYNLLHFNGALRPVPIKVSGRLRSRLGYYRLGTPDKSAPLIMISRRHLRRHGWDEVFETLLHEMVHQWQHENGLPVDHGPRFRAKAREVGVAPSARRPVA